MAELVLSEVSKVYADGTHAVDSLNLRVDSGELLVLVGPSGCGKTTALRMVAGLEDISSGQIEIGGKVVNRIPPRDRDVAMVFQSYALYPHLSVRDNIGFGLQLRKVPKSEIYQRVAQVADTLGLTDHLDRKPRNLSGGQRQRVAMGRAIVRRPQAFLMDEPLSNLDAKLRVQMRAEIARLQQELDVTTLYVTHDQVEAMTLGDRVAVMKKGVLQQVAPPQELYDQPVNIFVAGFIGSPAMNMFAGSLDLTDGAAKIRLGSQDLPLAAGQLDAVPALRDYAGRAVVVGIRPEDMEDAELVGDRPGGKLRSTVELIEAMGSDVLVHFALDTPPVLTEDIRELARDTGLEPEPGQAGRTVAVARFDPRTSARLNEPVVLHVITDKLHFFDPDTGLSLRAEHPTAGEKESS